MQSITFKIYDNLIGSKIRYANGKLLGTVRHVPLSSTYTVEDAHGRNLISILSEDSGCTVYDSNNKTIAEITNNNALVVGIGARLLPKPIVPLGSIPFGGYSGACTLGTLCIKSKKIYLDNNLVASYKCHKGYVASLLSDSMTIQAPQLSDKLICSLLGIFVYMNKR